MNEQMLPVFFWLTVAGAAAWLFLNSRLLRLLEDKHSRLYVKLGCPGLLLTARQPKPYGLLVFLLRRHFQQVADPELNRLCEGMLALFCLLVFTGGCAGLLLVKSWLGL